MKPLGVPNTEAPQVLEAAIAIESQRLLELVTPAPKSSPYTTVGNISDEHRDEIHFQTALLFQLALVRAEYEKDFAEKNRKDWRSLYSYFGTMALAIGALHWHPDLHEQYLVLADTYGPLVSEPRNYVMRPTTPHFAPCAIKSSKALVPVCRSMWPVRCRLVMRKPLLNF